MRTWNPLSSLSRTENRQQNWQDTGDSGQGFRSDTQKYMIILRIINKILCVAEQNPGKYRKSNETDFDRVTDAGI